MSRRRSRGDKETFSFVERGSLHGEAWKGTEGHGGVRRVTERTATIRGGRTAAGFSSSSSRRALRRKLSRISISSSSSSSSFWTGFFFVFVFVLLWRIACQNAHKLSATRMAMCQKFGQVLLRRGGPGGRPTEVAHSQRQRPMRRHGRVKKQKHRALLRGFIGIKSDLPTGLCERSCGVESAPAARGGGYFGSLPVNQGNAWDVKRWTI